MADYEARLHPLTQYMLDFEIDLPDDDLLQNL